MAIIPPKLKAGSRVRVIAPALSLGIIGADVRAEADRRLAALGLTVTFGDHAAAGTGDAFNSTPVDDRLADLHAAFEDPDVDGILTVIGGFNCNQLLDRIDYDLVAEHPKVLCGFSDVTALANAVFALAGIVTYSGPHYSTFGMKHHFDYTVAGFLACLLADGPIDIEASPTWSDDRWYLDQEARRIEPNEGWWVLNEGRAEGTILGGNLCTFNLLQGTRFLPSLEGSVLFLEDDEEVRPWHFDRDLVSLLQQPGFGGVQALVIGRFQRATGMTRELLAQIVATKPELSALPVMANVDFGHTSPLFTFPIGGTATVRADIEQPGLTISAH